MKHIKLYEDFVNEYKYDPSDIARIKDIAQRLADAQNKYNGGKSYTVDIKSLTDSRFQLLDKGQNNMGNWYFSVNIMGDVYLSDGVQDQFFFNEKDSDSKVFSKIKKILDKSTKETGKRWTSDEEDEENED
jgi:hypothetical protein